MRIHQYYAGLLVGQMVPILMATGLSLPSLYAIIGCTIGVGCFELERRANPSSIEMHLLPGVLFGLGMIVTGALLDGVLTPKLGAPEFSVVFRILQGLGTTQLGYSVLRHRIVQEKPAA